MTDRDRSQTLCDSEDECIEIDLVDLTESDDDIQEVNPTPSTRPRRNPVLNATRAQPSPQPTEDSELDFYVLSDGTIIHVTDFVELRCPPSRRREDPEHSGDYLRISKIIEHTQTGDISLQGHRFMREKYLVGKSFVKENTPLVGDQGYDTHDRTGPRLNELVMHLVVRADDNRPAQVQGLEIIPLNDVKRRQKVILTDKPYPMLSFHDLPQYSRASCNRASSAGRSRSEQHLHVFKKGPLVCRWCRISIVSPNGNVYGGAYRYLSKNEVTMLQNERQRDSHPSRRANKAPHEEIAASCDLGLLPPFESEPYTFFDAFSGSGGASRGADQAGLKILGGFDHNEIAMEAWERNNPDAIPLNLDSFAFLKNEAWKIIRRCDILNISFPCQPYSSAHRVKGKDDEINIDQLFVIKPLIEVLNPRVVVLENTSGLANFAENRQYFNKVLNDVMSAGNGYNLRYMIVNMADYGLPQPRKRLIIIAARKGTPLPPFPKPTHGPPGSGLKPYVSIGDALQVLDRLGQRAERDNYHKAHRQVPPEDWLYDPYQTFVDCIVTAGVKTKHWTGEDFTPRDLACLQHLPWHHHLAGTYRQAIKQVGNMFPPPMSEPVYRVCAQTLEAFDHGLIDADEDIDELETTLIEKGANIPKILYTPTSLIDLTDSKPLSRYRYLSRPSLSDAKHVKHSSAWAKRNFNDPDTPAKKKAKTRLSRNNLFEDTSSYEGDSPFPVRQEAEHSASRSKESAFWRNFKGKTLHISDDEDDWI